MFYYAVGGVRLGLGDTSDRGDSADEMGDNLPAVDLGTGESTSSARCFVRCEREHKTVFNATLSQQQCQTSNRSFMAALLVLIAHPMPPKKVDIGENKKPPMLSDFGELSLLVCCRRGLPAGVSTFPSVGNPGGRIEMSMLRCDVLLGDIYSLSSNEISWRSDQSCWVCLFNESMAMVREQQTTTAVP